MAYNGIKGHKGTQREWTQTEKEWTQTEKEWTQTEHSKHYNVGVKGM